MTWWQRLWRRKRLEEELRFHLDQHTADLIARGLDPEEARRRAGLALGGSEQVKERCRCAITSPAICAPSFCWSSRPSCCSC
ncbi:MAG TPA: permease prefix domain 1-containing protein [Blastocatellia bacterium]|nr:permease prefix domain 1-containing protein [Blastocatellia bacterium]